MRIRVVFSVVISTNRKVQGTGKRVGNFVEERGRGKCVTRTKEDLLREFLWNEFQK